MMVRICQEQGKLAAVAILGPRGRSSLTLAVVGIIAFFRSEAWPAYALAADGRYPGEMANGAAGPIPSS